MNLDKINEIEYYDTLQHDDTLQSDDTKDTYIKIYPFNNGKSYNIKCVKNCKEISNYNFNLYILFILLISLIVFLTYIMVHNKTLK